MWILRESRRLAPAATVVLALLCLAAVMSAWLLTHLAYAGSYARHYFRTPEGGLDFPGDRQPDYWDFVYFSFTLGMCFQVSDVTIQNHRIRRMVVGHALISFAYNTAILASAMDLISGLWS
jgi:uncharacterized membrane protein